MLQNRWKSSQNVTVIKYGPNQSDWGPELPDIQNKEVDQM